MQYRSQMALGVLVMATLAGCPDEEFVQLAPRIQVDVCKEQGIKACLVDFETVALSTRATAELTISNPSNVVLNLEEPTFSADSDPSFRVEHYPNRVAEGISSKMLVSYRPMVETPVTATLLIHSDAVNVNDGEPVAVTLKGQGIDNGLPQIEVVAQSPCVGTYPGTTEAADLGITGVGYPAACTFEIFNRGTKDLVVERISFIPEETAYGFEFVGRVPGIDDNGERFESVIPPPEPGNTSSRSFVARGVPSGLGIFRAMILIESNDPGCAVSTSPCPDDQIRSRVRVPLKVEGAHTPTAVARIHSVNGDTEFDPRQIEPLDDVLLTAEDSQPSSRNLRLTEYRWEIINQPSGSHGYLDDTSSMTPRFMFNNSGRDVAGVDIAGFWEVRLTVVDSRGASSVNEAVVSFNAIPTEAIHVQLVWDHPNSDVDLHLLRDMGNGSYDPFSDDDCYFGNCKVQSGDLEWFPSDEAANPTLDVDDLNGYGPENINIKVPRPGTYKVAVHYWSDHGEGDTVAVIRLFLFGNLHSEYIAQITSSDWWEVATIDWPSRTVTVIDTITPDMSGY